MFPVPVMLLADFWLSWRRKYHAECSCSPRLSTGYCCSHPPNPVIDVGSIPKNKSDLLRFYVANEQVEVEDSVFQDFLYLGWVRGETSGSTNMDFEFNQSTVLSANGVTPKRTSRDI